MEDYKVRFIKEYKELKDRCEKLNRMLECYYAGTLDFELTCPIMLLEAQLRSMSEYLICLERRAEIEKIPIED